jgi:hypothetical protein
MVKAWLRRKFPKILIIFMAIGIVLLGWTYFNSPSNINRMTSTDWNNFHASGIGTATVEKLASNAPYQNIEDVNKVVGIGPAKMVQINRYFTTWDTAKPNIWIIALLLGIVITSLSIFLYARWKINHKHDVLEFKDSVFEKK